MSREAESLASPSEVSPLLPRSEVVLDSAYIQHSFLFSFENNTSRSFPHGHRPSNGIARKSLGIILLLATVFFWTASNFLSSTIFADDTYSKPYFVTYINTSFFAIPLPFILFNRFRTQRRRLSGGLRATKTPRIGNDPNPPQEPSLQFTPPDSYGHEDIPQASGQSHDSRPLDGPLTVPEAYYVEGCSDVRGTARLGLEFCLLWFGANYFVSACLKYTTVASSTILTSTSSVWTLLIGVVLGVENFTLRKLLGVMTSLAGIALISTVDISGDNDKNRGSFPPKTPHQVAEGDVLALASAILYGFYTIFMKKRVGGEANLSMPLFFGFVGMINLIALWPGIVLLNFTGAEVFEWPTTPRVWVIVIVNSTISLLSDFCWAYATLLTSPILVTVGLSLSIPLSLIGQILVNSQTATGMYWVGAAIVCFAFIIVNYETEDSDRYAGNAKQDLITES